MKQQTAVEYLVSIVQKCIVPDYIPIEIIHQAIAMEKDQIMNAYQDAKCNSIIGFCSKNESEQYYNETYKN